ncbi:MAG: GntR family transcriptional regulator [Actinomycetota bacterium]|nr:GntR family transcriptional regulator [Actinomycetota bacterium]
MTQPPPDPTPLDRASPLPLWAQLQEDLTRRLAVGAFDAGFPGEMELVQVYEVSRHTVREALRRLRETGVLDSARGRGTRVRRAVEQPLGSLYSLFREIEARGLKQTSVVLTQQVKPSQRAARALGLPHDAPVFHLERLRMADGEPLAHDCVWMPASICAQITGSDFRCLSLYDELARQCGIRLTGGTERISARVPTEHERSLLSVPPGVACFSVQRLGCLGTKAVEYRTATIRGDRYSVVADWSAHGYTLGARTEGRRNATSCV